jgi:chromosome segregation ATPase
MADLINKLTPNFIDRMSVNQGELQHDQSRIDESKQKVGEKSAQVDKAKGDLAAREAEAGMSVGQAQEFKDNFDRQSDAVDGKISDANERRDDINDRLGNLAKGFKKTLSADEKAELTSLLGLQDRTNVFTKDDWTATLEARVLEMPEEGWARRVEELRADGYDRLADQLQGMRDNAAKLREELKGAEAEIAELVKQKEALPETLKQAEGVLELLEGLEHLQGELEDANGEVEYWQKELASDQADMSAKVGKLQGRVRETEGKLAEARSALGEKTTEFGGTAEEARALYNGGFGRLEEYQGKVDHAQEELDALERRRNRIGDGFKDGLSADEKAELSSRFGLQDNIDLFSRDDWTKTLEARVLNMPEQGWERRLTDLRADGYGELADKLQALRTEVGELDQKIGTAREGVQQAQAELEAYPQRFEKAEAVVHQEGQVSRLESQIARQQAALAETRPGE